MKKVVVLLANGFEDAEALCPIDVMRRAGFDVTIAGIGGMEITSSHSVVFKADKDIEELNSDGWDLVFAPGGMPGSVNISQSWKANEMLITAANRENSYVAAICAAPAVVLGPIGLLFGKEATCYPGCEDFFPGFEFSKDGVVVSGNIVTAKSAGYAFDLGLKLIELLENKELSDKIKNQIYYKV